MSYLGFYLDTLFNIRTPSDGLDLFVLGGMSEPIDRYFNSRDAGVQIARPKVKLQPLFKAITSRLGDRRPEGWTTAGYHLLSSSSPSEQRIAERGLNKLRAAVRRDFRDPDHTRMMVISPSSREKAAVAFYLVAEREREQIKSNIEKLAAQAIEGRKACVLFARSIDNWEHPYEACLIVSDEETKLS